MKQLNKIIALTYALTSLGVSWVNVSPSNAFAKLQHLK